MSKMMKKLNNKRGFTLIELIVVMAIIGILVMLAAPRFLGYTRDAEVAAMKADAKVLSNAALIYNIEETQNDVDAWPVTDGEVTIPAGLSIEGTVKKLDEGAFKDHVKNLRGKFEDYALITSGKYEGEVIHINGVENRDGETWHGVSDDFKVEK